MAWVGAFPFSNQRAGFTRVMVDVNAMVCMVSMCRHTLAFVQTPTPAHACACVPLCVCVCVCVCEDG